MDILSIRKKGKKPPEQPKQEQTTPPAAASPPPPAPAPPAAPRHALTAQAQQILEETYSAPPLPPFPEIQLPNQTVLEEAAAPAGPVLGADDPLRGFLAIYDDESMSTDKPTAPVENSDAARRFLSFRLVDEDYAASIMDIREILTIRSLTEVPRAPKEVLGVVSKRGEVLPVIDLATSLGLRAPERRLRASQRVLVVGHGDRVCGLRVDSVSEVIKLQTGQIEEVPASLGARNAGLLLGLGRTQGTLYILLDVAAVLDAFAIATGVTPMPRAEG